MLFPDRKNNSRSKHKSENIRKHPCNDQNTNSNPPSSDNSVIIFYVIFVYLGAFILSALLLWIEALMEKYAESECNNDFSIRLRKFIKLCINTLSLFERMFP
jgi:hypothetical protein